MIQDDMFCCNAQGKKKYKQNRQRKENSDKQDQNVQMEETQIKNVRTDTSQKKGLFKQKQYYQRKRIYKEI